MAKRRKGKQRTQHRVRIGGQENSRRLALDTAESDSGWGMLWGAVLLLVVLSLWPFWQVHSFAFLNYDDPLHVAQQTPVLAGLSLDSFIWALTATPLNLWHPLTWWSFMLEVDWLGGGAQAPGVHHLGNLVLHVAAGVVFFAVLRRLSCSLAWSFVGAMLFILHPLHVEPVAWISARKDVLSGLLGLTSILSYLQYRAVNKDLHGKHDRWWWISVFMALAAMCAKPVAVVLPLLLVITDFLRVKGAALPRAAQRSWMTLVGEKWLFFALSCAVGVLTIAIQYQGSLAADINQQNLASRLLLLPAKLAFYSQRMIWPLELNFEYAQPQGAHFIALTIAGALGGLLAIWTGITQSTSRPALWAGLLWFLVCLGPMSGVIFVGGDFTADRYTYLALAGPCLGLALFGQNINPPWATFGLVLGVLVGLAYGVLSEQQSRAWKDNLSLFSRGVEVQPRSATAHTNLAGVMRLRGENEKALLHYQTALQLDGSNYIIEYNIAGIYYQRNELGSAVSALRASLESNSNYARSHLMLGQVMDRQAIEANQSLSAAALNHMRFAYDQDPSQFRFAAVYAQGLLNRGQQRQAAEVLRQLESTIALSPRERQVIQQLYSRAR